jgi:3-oxoacyl-[acyl-carrier-protein] synthase III
LKAAEVRNDAVQRVLHHLQTFYRAESLTPSSLAALSFHEFNDEMVAAVAEEFRRAA